MSGLFWSLLDAIEVVGLEGETGSIKRRSWRSSNLSSSISAM
jgi:hypothetical protein